MKKDEALIKYEEAFAWQCNKYRNRMIKGEFLLNLKVYYPSRRQDLDNSFKIILDCLQACKAIKNDRNCTKIIAERLIDKDNPRIEFYLEEI